MNWCLYHWLRALGFSRRDSYVRAMKGWTFRAEEHIKYFDQLKGTETTMKQPSDFEKHPYDSVHQRMETEVVARNIMVILSRTGNTWRRLTWEEYQTERLKDGEFTMSEFREFEAALPYCTSESQARLFSPEWRDV